MPADQPIRAKESTSELRGMPNVRQTDAFVAPQPPRQVFPHRFRLTRPVPAGELAVMRRLDELHLDYPFAGSRMLRDLLRAEDTDREDDPAPGIRV